MSKAEGYLSTVGFYGKKNKRKWIGLENAINSVVKKHQREKVPKSFPFRILGPTSTWQIFYRQQEAFQFTKSTAKDLHVFAFESETFEGNTGQRLYLSASYPVFWHYYSQLDEDKRLHYEVIPEGAVCKLYFDLEYDKTMNTNCDGDNMVDIFIQYVCMALKASFSVTCTRKDVLDLQASTDRKFSRHLVFQMKKSVFKDNIHAGRFVCNIMARLLEKIYTSGNTGTDCRPEQVDTSGNTGTDSRPEQVDTSGNTGTDSRPEQVDTSGNTGTDSRPEQVDTSEKHTDTLHSIYTNTETSAGTSHENNQNVLNQMDKGENDDMLATGVNETEHNGVEKGTDSQSVDKDKNQQGETEDNLKEVIESFSVEDLHKLMVKNKHGEDVLFCDTGVYTKNRNFRLFLSSKLGKKNPLVVAAQNKFSSKEDSQKSKLENMFYDSLVANVQYCSSMRILTFEGENLSGNMIGMPGKKREKSSQEAECIDGYSKSPYPEVDEYISDIITKDSGRGVIRHWTYFHQGELLVYEIAKYRYCHNIGRHHRSNNIMLVVDLHKGVWYQKCHDPDCHTQNYKSPEWQLPRNLLPASYFDDDLDLEMDDDELLNTTAELEKQYMEQQADCSGISELDDGADDELIAAVTNLDGKINVENG